MADVYCDNTYCKWLLDGKCSGVMISIGCDGCEDYEEFSKEEIAGKYPETYYALNGNGDITKDDGLYWEKRNGGKFIEWEGRKIVEDYNGFYTDARTGCGLGHDLNMILEKVPDMVAKLEAKVQECELSPLFNDNCKYVVKLSKELASE